MENNEKLVFRFLFCSYNGPFKRRLESGISYTEFSYKVEKSEYNIVDLLVVTGLCPSKSEARRMVEQGGVKVNADKISDVNATIEINATILQKGKKNIIKVQN